MESLLHKYLFDGYQKDVHPLMKGNLTQNKAVSVTFDAQVIRILQVVSGLILIHQQTIFWSPPLKTPRQMGGGGF